MWPLIRASTVKAAASPGVCEAFGAGGGDGAAIIDCACTCQALHAAQGRAEELLKAYGAGEAAALDELQHIVGGIGACQGAMMACAR